MLERIDDGVWKKLCKTSQCLAITYADLATLVENSGNGLKSLSLAPRSPSVGMMSGWRST
jgi:hypothetical protein